MASTARAFNAILHKISSSNVLTASLSSLKATSYACRSSFWGRELAHEVRNRQTSRSISTSRPVCMGRRSCKIAGRKEAQNLKKMKRNSKIGKEIVSVIQKGGPNPSSNTVLAAILEKARELEVPKDIIERNIKRAAEKGQEAYIEKIYEVYGFGGVGMVVEVLTDKVTRSVADVRGVVKDCGAKLADPGSILFKFKRSRVVNIKNNHADKDQLLGIALDTGAEDGLEPTAYDDDTEEGHADSYYKIVTSAENYSMVLSKLRDEGVAFEPDNGYELLPLNPIEVDDEAMDLNKDLMTRLLELDDVDAVYSDQK